MRFDREDLEKFKDSVFYTLSKDFQTDGLARNILPHISRSVETISPKEMIFDPVKYQINLNRYLDLYPNRLGINGTVPDLDIYTYPSPEARALVVGRFDVTNEGIGFISSRLDVGTSSLFDIAALSRQIVESKPFVEIVSNYNNLGQIVYYQLIRDPGDDIEIQLSNLMGETIPFTQIHISHIQYDDAENNYGRYVAPCSIKHEGFRGDQIKTAIYSDWLASGMQMGVSISTTLIDYFKEVGNRVNIDHIFIHASLASLRGSVITALTIAKQAELLHLPIPKTSVFTSASVLHALQPDYYYCPTYPEEFGLNVDIGINIIREFLYGKRNAYILCSKCNWMASRYLVEKAYEDSEIEMNRYESSNQQLINNQRLITPDLMRSYGINPYNYVSTATLINARRLGMIRQLEEYLDEEH